MTNKKKLLLLTTGGTIASLPGGKGLEPQRSEVMERELEQLRTYYDITVRDVMCLDSSNIRPEEWQLIARRIFEDREGFDGIVVSHGTDTMAYTASAVTYMLPQYRSAGGVYRISAASGGCAERRTGQSAYGLCHGGIGTSRRIPGL